MNIIATALALGLALGTDNCCTWQASSAQAPAQSAMQAPSVQQLPVMPVDTTRRAVQITQGPVVEQVTDTTAEIAWSTNVNSGNGPALRH